MESASLWGFLHILLVMLWLGTDIGAFPYLKAQ